MVEITFYQQLIALSPVLGVEIVDFQLIYSQALVALATHYIKTWTSVTSDVPLARKPQVILN